jgi:hypothetical protein
VAGEKSYLFVKTISPLQRKEQSPSKSERRGGYGHVCADVMQNKNLSSDARFLYALAMSFPQGKDESGKWKWTWRASHLRSLAGWGRRKYFDAIRELKTAGIVKESHDNVYDWSPADPSAQNEHCSAHEAVSEISSAQNEQCSKWALLNRTKELNRTKNLNRSKNLSPDGEERENGNSETDLDLSEENTTAQSQIEPVDENETVTLPGEALVLTPPTEKRHTLFREATENAYLRNSASLDCPWGPAEGMQLAKLLRENPRLDVETFTRWLENYHRSQDHLPGERPCKYLPRIHDYSETVIDKFRRSPMAIAVTVKDQNALRTEMAFGAVRAKESRLREEPA